MSICTEKLFYSQFQRRSLFAISYCLDAGKRRPRCNWINWNHQQQVVLQLLDSVGLLIYGEPLVALVKTALPLQVSRAQPKDLIDTLFLFYWYNPATCDAVNSLAKPIVALASSTYHEPNQNIWYFLILIFFSIDLTPLHATLWITWCNKWTCVILQVWHGYDRKGSPEVFQVVRNLLN